MRTLKKSLCLVLALVMMLGLGAFSVSADNFDGYTDAAQVNDTYKEAVDTLIGAGVVEGMTTTTLSPTGNYTRAQAAKIVAYLSLGQEAAANLKASSAPFDDVPATYWAAGFISYCVSAGLIKGYGDGSFGPDVNLTGTQFAAMLLRAIGYGKQGEYEGAAWEVNVTKDAMKQELFTGERHFIYDEVLDANKNEAIERQQAIQMAYNAMQMPDMHWSSLIGDYVAGVSGSAGGTGTAIATVLTPLSDNLRIAKVTTDTDETGARVEYWVDSLSNDEITNKYETDKVLAVSTDGTELYDLTTKGRKGYVASIEDDGVDVYLNGYQVFAAATVNDITTLETALGYNTALDITTAGDIDRGAVVTLYDIYPFNGKVDYITVQTHEVYTLDAAPTVKSAEGTVTIPEAGIDNVLTERVTGYEGLAKNDVIVVYRGIDSDGVVKYEIAKAEKINGVMTRFTAATASAPASYVIDGKTYQTAQWQEGLGADELAAVQLATVAASRAVWAGINVARIAAVAADNLANGTNFTTNTVNTGVAVTTANVVGGNALDYWIDANGYIVKQGNAPSTKTYYGLFLEDQLKNASGIGGTSASAKLWLLNGDNEKVVLDIVSGDNKAVRRNGSDTVAATDYTASGSYSAAQATADNTGANVLNALVAGDLFAYQLTDSGAIALSSIRASAAAQSAGRKADASVDAGYTARITKGAASVVMYSGDAAVTNYANADTLFFFYTNNNNCSVVKGYNNVANGSWNSGEAIEYILDGTALKAIMVHANATIAKNYVYLNGEFSQTRLDNGTMAYDYTVIGGDEPTVRADANTYTPGAYVVGTLSNGVHNLTRVAATATSESRYATDTTTYAGAAGIGGVTDTNIGGDTYFVLTDTTNLSTTYSLSSTSKAYEVKYDENGNVESVTETAMRVGGGDEFIRVLQIDAAQTAGGDGTYATSAVWFTAIRRATVAAAPSFNWAASGAAFTGANSISNTTRNITYSITAHGNDGNADNILIRPAAGTSIAVTGAEIATDGITVGGDAYTSSGNGGYISVTAGGSYRVTVSHDSSILDDLVYVITVVA